MQAMVLTLVGKDSPGLVEAIAQCIKSSDGNWLRSSFCQLSGQFAGFVEIMLPQEKHNELLAACHALSHLQITLVPSHEHADLPSRKAVIEVTANDRKGIVSDISSVLKTFNINILKMDTQCESAPNWGSPVFSARISMALSDNINLDDIKAAVEDITDDLMVEIQA